MGVSHVQMFKCYQIAQRISYFFEAFQSGLKFIFIKLIPILKKESENNENLGGFNKSQSQILVWGASYVSCQKRLYKMK